MRATIPYIERKFDEFNVLCFGGSLPRPPIELSNAKTFLGMCVYKKRRTLFGRTRCYDFRLRINTRIDLPESEIEDTIIHEMIHYHIALNGIRDTSAHGAEFRLLMNKINQTHGRNIRISHRISPEQREQAYDNRERWHVVAVVNFADGRTGLKVLPRIRERILRYYNEVGRADGIVSIELYMTKNVFFNRYPCSGALNIYYIERRILMEHLADAEVVRM